METIKIVLLSLLLLSINLSAHPNEIINALSKIVKNGWNEDNKTLNQKIISNYENSMPDIFQKINKPFIYSNETKIHKDYLLIIAYTKYLEKQGKVAESLNIDIDILKSLNNITNNSSTSLLLHMMIEKLVRDSLFELTEDNKNFKIDKKQFNEIKNGLILDKTLLIRTVEYEKKFAEKQYDELYKKIARDTKKQGKKSVEIISLISKEVEKNENLIYKKVFQAIDKGTEKSIKHLDKEFQEFRKGNECDNEQSQNFKSVKCIAKLLTVASIPYGFPTVLKTYFKTVKKNKLLVDKLKVRIK